METINTVKYIDNAFMDPGALNVMLNDKTLSEDQKIEVIGFEFEKLMLKEQLQKAFEPSFSNAVFDSKSDKGYGALVTDLLAHSLAKDSPLGISHVLQFELQKVK